PFGMMGDHILINGTYDPYVSITASQVRFRLVNASNARAYEIGFTDHRSFQLIANDSGQLPAPVEIERVLLSPGERAEIVVNFQPGEKTILHSYAGDKDGIQSGEFHLVKMRPADTLTAATPL